MCTDAPKFSSVATQSASSLLTGCPAACSQPNAEEILRAQRLHRQPAQGEDAAGGALRRCGAARCARGKVPSTTPACSEHCDRVWLLLVQQTSLVTVTGGLHQGASMIHREASHFPARGNLQQGRERACQSHMQLVAPGEKGIPSPPGKSRLLQGTEVGAGEESLRNVRGFQWGVIGICCPRPCWGDGGWYPKYNRYLHQGEIPI